MLLGSRMASLRASPAQPCASRLGQEPLHQLLKFWGSNSYCFAMCCSVLASRFALIKTHRKAGGLASPRAAS